MKLLYLGPEGSYSHIAAKQWSDHNNQDVEIESCKSFEALWSVLSDGTDAAIVPVENSSTSNVHTNVDYLFSGKYFISGELLVKIQLHLYGLPESRIENITTVLSHRKALDQVSHYCRRNQWQTQATSSTAKGASHIIEANQKNLAMVGSTMIKTIYPQLQLLQSNIGNADHNYTRFVVVQTKQRPVFEPDHNRASVLLTLPHTSGALAHVLMPLAQAGVNLTKIESRPIPNQPWEYRFWIDIETDTKEKLTEGCRLLDDHSDEYQLLGTYTKGAIYES